MKKKNRRVSHLRLLFLSLLAIYLLTQVNAQSKRVSSSLLLSNATPFDLEYVIIYSRSPKEFQLRGWYKLKAGESKEINNISSDVLPDFYVYARSYNRTITDEEYGFSVESEELPKFFYDSERYEVDGDIPVNINNKRLEFSFDPNIGSYKLPDEYTVNFIRAEEVVPKSGKFIKVFTFEPLIRRIPEDLMGKDALDWLLEVAPHIQSSIARTSYYNNQFPDGNQPILLGVVCAESDYLELGQKITKAEEILPFGQTNPIKRNDLLVELGGRRIFHIEDMRAILSSHALNTSKGIKKPISFTVLRGGSYISGNTSYFFNYDYWKNFKGIGEGSAFYRGALSGVTLGTLDGRAANLVENGGKAAANTLIWGLSKVLDENISYYEFDFSKDTVFWETQLDAANQQFYPDEYKWGDRATLLISPGKVIGKQLVSKKGKRFLATRAGTVAVELMEAGIYTLNTGFPLQEIDEKIEEYFKLSAPLSVAGGLLGASAGKGLNSAVK